MKVTPFHPSHFGAIRPNEIDAEAVARVTPDYLAALAEEPSVTLWIDGRPMAVAGVLGGCELWGLVDRDIRPHRFALFRAARRFLSTFDWLYANVDTLAAPACRFIQHLGFRRKRSMKRGERTIVRFERVSA